MHPFALLGRFFLPAALLLGVAPAHAGLIAHWKFDETSGVYPADSSGNGHRGLFHSTMTQAAWTTGHLGGAVALIGGYPFQYITVGNSVGATTPPQLLNNLGDVTFSGWINREDPISSYNQRILYADSLVDFVVHSNDKLRLNFGDGASLGSATESGSTIPVNQWVHVAGTRSGSTVKVYIDGVLEGTATNSRSGATAYSISYIGGGGVDTLNGLIDDIRYYDHALSASEVSALAGGGGSAAPAPEPAETFAFLGLLAAFDLGFREWRSRRKAQAA